jgi:hypothetical protein
MTLRLMIKGPLIDVVDIELESLQREQEVLEHLHNERSTDFYPELVSFCFKHYPAGCWIVQGAVFSKGTIELTEDDIAWFHVRIMH